MMFSRPCLQAGKVRQNIRDHAGGKKYSSCTTSPIIWLFPIVPYLWENGLYAFACRVYIFQYGLLGMLVREHSWPFGGPPGLNSKLLKHSLQRPTKILRFLGLWAVGVKATEDDCLSNHHVNIQLFIYSSREAVEGVFELVLEECVPWEVRNYFLTDRK